MRITQFDGGTAANVFTRSYVLYLLKNSHTPKIPVDDLVLNSAHTNYRPHIAYQIDPAPAPQNQFLNKPDAAINESDLQDDRYSAPPSVPLSPPQKAWHGFTRFGRNIKSNLFHTRKVIRFDKD